MDLTGQALFAVQFGCISLTFSFLETGYVLNQNDKSSKNDKNDVF